MISVIVTITTEKNLDYNNNNLNIYNNIEDTYNARNISNDDIIPVRNKDYDNLLIFVMAVLFVMIMMLV